MHNTFTQSWWLTEGADTLDPLNATVAMKTTAGDDTFRAPANNFLASTDYIDGGAGNDTLVASVTAAGQTLAPVLKNIENITLTIAATNEKTTTFNAVDTTGATTISIKDAGAVGATYTTLVSDERITVSNLAKTTTLGIIGGTESPRVSWRPVGLSQADTAA